MDTITFGSDLICDALMIPMRVVDRCLKEANESQLKIYLYLLKNQGTQISVSQIADFFNYTEQDVKRALRFWNRKAPAEERVQAKVNAEGNTEGNVVEFAIRPTYTSEKLAETAAIPEVSQLLFVAEQYMGRPLKADDISSIVYMYDELKFSAELIEYLIEYCISNNKKTFRSIESVALSWKEDNVTTVDEAKRLTRKIPSEMKDVLAALGFAKDHVPVDAEIGFVRRWTESYGYGMDIIKIACERTVLSTGKPSIRYANSIIKGWHDAKVKSVSDILALDEEFKRKKAGETGTKKKSGKPESGDDKKSGGKFRNFSERDIDFSSILSDIATN